jgi:anti-sigma factor RsiW
MTGRVLQFDAGAHKVVDALLPWYVNGTLSAEEHEYVRQHLGECAQCRREADWLRELHAACVAAQATPEGSKALAPLRRHLEAPRSGSGLWDRLRHAWAGSGAWGGWAVAASVLVGLLAVSSIRDSSAPALYRTLAAPESAARTGSLIVVFDPSTTEANLRRMLREAGARVIDGPTQSNAYVLDVPAERRDDAMRALHAERSVILVERLSQEARR